MKCAVFHLAIHAAGVSIGPMSRVCRALILALTLAVLYAGPVAACVCPLDLSMPAMPCCPDHSPSGQTDLGMLPTFETSCAISAVSLLPAPAQRVPAPVARAPAPIPALHALDPPRPASRFSLRADVPAPPIYLVTLRLRN